MSAYNEEQIAILGSRGISPAHAEAHGVITVQNEEDLAAAFDSSGISADISIPDYWTVANGYLPGLLFTYRSIDGVTVVPQLRPDVAVVDLSAEGSDKVRKYVFPPDAPSVLHQTGAMCEPEGDDLPTVLIVEGTIQTIAAAGALGAANIAVYGIAGCQSWMKRGVPTGDLAVVKGAEVLICLDADAATNLNVYNAGVALREAAIAEGADTVRFIRVPGGGKSGLDDVLAGRAPESRTEYVMSLISIARKRPRAEKPDLPSASKPKAKGSGKDDEPASPYFTTQGSLQVKTLVGAVVGNRPAALTRENKIALYMNGVYKIDGTGFLSEVASLLEEQFRTSHQANAEAYAVGMMKQSGIVLPDRMNVPVMNTLTGMVDLRTGEVVDHDPGFMSTVQFPVEWDPNAVCPAYEAWAAEQIGDQLDDLEETVAGMLDPSVTPTKAAFLFGPARSGKSTYLRLLQEIAGSENTSGVSLHQLSESRFASASLYGKTLNISADLSAAHVEDISIFKMMTGEDLIHADRKFGHTFDFVNRALFAFSANELPTVGESSRAYSERIKPFQFAKSFAGAEDPTLEARLREELPGILVRLQRAYARKLERGRPLPTNPTVMAVFEEASDRVRQFVRECCEVVTVESTSGGTKGGGISTISQLYVAFQRWASNEGKATLAKSKLKLRLSNVPGVVEHVSSGKSRGWNLRILHESEWGNGSDASISQTATTPPVSVTSKPEDLPKPGALYLRTHCQPVVDFSVSSTADTEGVNPPVPHNGLEGTKLHAADESADPLDHVLHLAEPVDFTLVWRRCPGGLDGEECGRVEELTDSGFMYACRVHAPKMFGDTSGAEQ